MKPKINNDHCYDGLYKYFVKDFKSGQLLPYQVRCVVLGETDKSYRIRLLEPIYRRVCGSEFWVKKKNVLRSYLRRGTMFCDEYNMEVVSQSCVACLRKCLTAEKLRTWKNTNLS
jgi:hypothetical protein